MDNYLTTKQAAERLNVVPSRIRRMILDGVIQAEKIGRDNFISEVEISRLEKQNRKPGRPPKTANGNQIKDKAEKPFKTIFDVAPELVGCIDSGLPSDLSTNKEYLKDLGKKSAEKRALKIKRQSVKDE
ncbi:hypothetical protein BH20ACI1_BH20ACI1_06470 [soil metagenome]